MKCENCGGNLSLEDLNCPYCGSINKHAQQHVHDMKRYHGEFQDTKKDVYATTKKYTGITVRLLIIAVLLILSVVMAIIGSQSYSIRRHLLEKRAERNYAEYSVIMDTYLENEEYIAFHTFVEANSIYGYDTPYEKYIPVIRVSAQYMYVYDYIMGLHTKLYRDTDKESIERQIMYLSEQLNDFYDAMDMENYNYINGADAPLNQEAIAQMEQNIKALLQTYCGLTNEDVTGLQKLSEAKRMVLLEERIGYAE